MELSEMTRKKNSTVKLSTYTVDIGNIYVT